MRSMLWFSGVRLYVQSANGMASFPAVSGKPSVSERGGLRFSYSLASQADKDRGPIPAGNYLINTNEIIEFRHSGSHFLKAAIAPLVGAGSPAAYLEQLERAWGRMPGATGKIIPIRAEDGSTDYAFGRNRCWIHGSDFPGSIGCIDLTSFMHAFLAVLPKTSPTIIPLRVMYGFSPVGTEPSDIDRYGRDVSNVA